MYIPSAHFYETPQKYERKCELSCSEPLQCIRRVVYFSSYVPDMSNSTQIGCRMFNNNDNENIAQYKIRLCCLSAHTIRCFMYM